MQFVRFLFRTLTVWFMMLGAYLLYGLILMDTTDLLPNSATFVAIDIAVSFASTLVLSIANIAVED